MSKRSLLNVLILVTVLAAITGTVWGQCATCGLAAVNIPADTIMTAAQSPSAGDNASSYLTITPDFVSPSGVITEGTRYLGWCVDDPNTAVDAGPFGVPVSTLSPSIPLANPNWFRVNWVLNNKNGSYRDIQNVIWRLLYNTGGRFPNTPVSDALYAQAMAVTSFTPGPGQILGILFFQDGFGGAQDTMIEIRIPDCGRIGDYVWLDGNRNGVQDPDEQGIDGVRLNLYNASNTLVGSTQTATVGGRAGMYLFSGLCTGQYRVEVVPPAGMNASPTGAGSPTTDSNPNNSLANIVENDPARREDLTIDFGFAPPACVGRIGNLVWLDNGDGIYQTGETGVPNVVVQLFDSTGVFLRQETTSGSGQYLFENVCNGTYRVAVLPATIPSGYVATPSRQGGDDSADSNGSPDNNVVVSTAVPNQLTIDFGYRVPCTGSIGNFVWLDSNNNGLQDNGEPGINGVTLQLKNANNVVIAQVTTSNGGQYSFNGLCAGSYSVLVDASTVPVGYTATAQPAVPNAEKDSNPIPAPVVLSTNSATNETIDFGYKAPCNATLGDRVWLDSNANGIQDSGEFGLSNVTVRLLRASDNSVVQSTTTGLLGDYKFSGLCTGDYKIEVTNPSSPVRPQPGLKPTTVGAPGSTTANDSNPNPTAAAAVSGTDNPTFDFGFRPDGFCTRTQGYWKNHEEAWPVTQLYLGDQLYTRAELLAIFRTPVRGDDSISLAHQLIAAKLNMYAGAAMPSVVPSFISNADSLLSGFGRKLPYGRKNSTMVTTANILDQYNNGKISGASHCQ